MVVKKRKLPHVSIITFGINIYFPEIFLNADGSNKIPEATPPSLLTDTYRYLHSC